MKHTVIHIKEMDCPSEEQMIRMRFAGFDFIENLDFNFSERLLHVFHSGDSEVIAAAVRDIGFTPVIRNDSEKRRSFSAVTNGPVLLSGVKAAEKQQSETDRKTRERRALILVLIINAGFFAAEAAAGIIGESMGLLADSLDMLADSLVYSISLFAVSASLAFKKRTALLSGLLQTGLALLGFSEIIRRFYFTETVPDYILMIGVSAAALAGNAASLAILQKARSGEVHIQSSMIFTSNDILANAGVIAAGIITLFTASPYPDLIIGSVVFAFVMQGAFRILRLSAKA